MSHAAAKWATESSEAAEWAATLSDQELRLRLLSAMAVSWADSDPRLAARFAAEQLSPGDTQDRAILAILQRWVLRQPDAARSWVEQFPAGELRHEALATISQTSSKLAGTTEASY